MAWPSAFQVHLVQRRSQTLRQPGNLVVPPEMHEKQSRLFADQMIVQSSDLDPVPSQFFFRDVDGNRFLIVQPD